MLGTGVSREAGPATELGTEGPLDLPVGWGQTSEPWISVEGADVAGSVTPAAGRTVVPARRPVPGAVSPPSLLVRRARLLCPGAGAGRPEESLGGRMVVRRTVVVPMDDLSGMDPADFEHLPRRFDRLGWTSRGCPPRYANAWTILSDFLRGYQGVGPPWQASACCEDATPYRAAWQSPAASSSHAFCGSRALSGCDSVVSMPLPSSTTDRDRSRPDASPAPSDPATELPLPREEMA